MPYFSANTQANKTRLSLKPSGSYGDGARAHLIELSTLSIPKLCLSFRVLDLLDVRLSVQCDQPTNVRLRADRVVRSPTRRFLCGPD